MVIAPVVAFLFFTTLMDEGLPAELPAGVVDEDNTSTTREVIRNLDAFQQTNIIEHYPDVAAARKAMQRGKIYAFYYIPKGTTQLAISGKQPTVSFYTAASYLIPGSLEYRDMKMMSEYASGAVGRATLYAKGYTEDQAMAVLQPIKMGGTEPAPHSVAYFWYQSEQRVAAIERHHPANGLKTNRYCGKTGQRQHHPPVKAQGC